VFVKKILPSSFEEGPLKESCEADSFNGGSVRILPPLRFHNYPIEIT